MEWVTKSRCLLLRSLLRVELPSHSYPVVASVELSPQLKALGTFEEDQLNARVFAQNNAEALKIMDRAGWK